MKNTIFKSYIFSAVISILFISLFVTLINGCAETKAISEKSGAQLWAENCQRCHNTPSPVTFSAEQWETVGMHMQTRSLITQKERNKIVEFLQSNR